MNGKGCIAPAVRHFLIVLAVALFLESESVQKAQQKFAAWDIPLPGDDKELVYAPLGTPEADAYLDDLALGANFATVNHLLINALVLEAFQEIIPGVKGSLVYFISHNIARKELLPDGHGGFAGEGWVHRTVPARYALAM
jgi:tRNA-splicing ligase RtcB (3'-phosphate/5'-hydroxy nucleic acid ligase)